MFATRSITQAILSEKKSSTITKQEMKHFKNARPQVQCPSNYYFLRQEVLGH